MAHVTGTQGWESPCSVENIREKLFDEQDRFPVDPEYKRALDTIESVRKAVAQTKPEYKAAYDGGQQTWNHFIGNLSPAQEHDLQVAFLREQHRQFMTGSDSADEMAVDARGKKGFKAPKETVGVEVERHSRAHKKRKTEY
ncbi:hypothetical protein VHEMI06570 [[Torrubiella] hemipterigena]|uniref:Uncharacterized protein n=1 Tax=[Torrubiella] hemipterigena TaxID=1531966 RepID=A0A0A1T7N9_9HYPO|nr:hypothetical protein VHEMI06570 [[Torrubiella] hemipterigena]